MDADIFTMSISTLARPTAPRITAAMLSAALVHRNGVIVQEDSGATYAAERLTAAQLDDPAVVVLLDHDLAAAFLRDAMGKPGVAARLASEYLRTLYVRGFLAPAEISAEVAA